MHYVLFSTGINVGAVIGSVLCGLLAQLYGWHYGFGIAALIIIYGGALINPLWPILYSIGLGIAFLYYWPTLLALVSRAAPPSVNATMMGIAYMSRVLESV